MRTGSLLASAIALGVGAILVLFLRYAATGKAVRSVIQDEEGAQLCGVSPEKVRAFVFALSGVLAALVAVTRSMTSPVTVNMIDFTILALIVAVVGGLGSVSAFLAGILLGIVNTVKHYIGSYITTIVLLGAAAITIVLRPSGLLGAGRGDPPGGDRWQWAPYGGGAYAPIVVAWLVALRCATATRGR